MSEQPMKREPEVHKITATGGCECGVIFGRPYHGSTNWINVTCKNCLRRKGT